MVEILFLGRGGQGAFTAAKLLGAAYVSKGEDYYALAFPSFGPERRGAPVRAYVKLDRRPIGSRGEIRKSDFVIFLDDTLFTPETLSWLKPNGLMLVNTEKTHADQRIVTLDADRIAQAFFKLPVANTVLLGALAAVFTDITPKDLETALALNLPPRFQAGNQAAVRAAYDALHKEEAV